MKQGLTWANDRVAKGKFVLVNLMERLGEEVGDHYLESFPRKLQFDDYSCAARSTSAVLDYYGVRLRRDTVMERLGTDEDGTDMSRIPAFFRRLGFRVTATNRGTKAFIQRAIQSGAPVIACVTPIRPHAVVVHGVGRGRVYVADPSLLRRFFSIGSWAGFSQQWDGEGFAIHWKWGCAARRQGQVVEVVGE